MSFGFNFCYLYLPSQLLGRDSGLRDRKVDNMLSLWLDCGNEYTTNTETPFMPRSIQKIAFYSCCRK